MPEVIPVTVVSGFLGSGKTTLLNRLLKTHHGKKLAVVVNEMGEVGVDGALLTGGARFVELDNGCLCCALNTDLVQTLGEIGERPEIEQVIIETTGVADPLPIGHAVMRHELKGRFRLDALVTTVDALNVERSIAEAAEAALQIRRADICLMTKCDLVDRRRRAEVRALIETHNPYTRILRSDEPDALPLLLDAHIEGELALFRKDDDPIGATPTNDDDHVPANGECAAHDHGPECEHLHTPGANRHHGFKSISFRMGDRSTLRLMFQEFLEQLPRGVYRSKGIVRIEGEAGRLIFHTVGGRVDFWHDSESREPGRIVLIGRDFPLETMREEVESLFSNG
jgi:G3E family GTPase